jgi:hypothetical protein
MAVRNAPLKIRIALRRKRVAVLWEIKVVEK